MVGRQDSEHKRGWRGRSEGCSGRFPSQNNRAGGQLSSHWLISVREREKKTAGEMAAYKKITGRQTLHFKTFPFVVCIPGVVTDLKHTGFQI